MVTIPRYQPRTMTPVGGQQLRSGVQSIGGDLQAIGQGLRLAGSVADQLVTERDRRAAEAEREEAERQRLAAAEEKATAEAWSAPVLSQAALDMGAGWYDDLAETGDDGAGLEQRISGRIDQVYDPIIQSATTPTARQLAEDAKRKAQAEWVPKAREKTWDSRQAWFENQGKVAQGTAIAAIQSARTPEDVDAIFAQQVQALTPLYGSIQDPELRQDAQLKGVQGLADAAYERRMVLAAQQTGELPAQGVTGPLATSIRQAAIDANISPELALVVVALESGGDPNAKNPKSSAHGLFQFLDETWKDVGGGDRRDVPTQIRNGVAYLKKVEGELTTNLRRRPQPWEVYLGHQQGPAGATALLTAGPGVTAIDALTPVLGPERARAAVLNNGGTARMTAADFAGRWQRKFNAQAAAGAVDRLATPAGRERGRKAAEGEIEAQREARVGALEIALDSDQATEADIEAARQRGDLKPGSPTDVRLTRKAREAAEKRAEKAAQTARVDAALNGGVPIDPTNAKDREAVDDDYAARAATWAPEAMRGNSIEYAARVGYVPEAMKARMVGGMRSTDPQKRLEAARTYGDLRARNPALTNGIPADVASDAYYILESQRKGMDPKEAVDSLAFAEKMTPEEITQRDRAYVAALGPKQAGATDFLARSIGQDRPIREARGMFGGDFTVPPEMQADFVWLATRHYRRTGDVEAANAAAYDQVRRVWGPSVINGDRRMMKNAPEVIYGIPEMSVKENADWMRDQAARELGVKDAKSLRFVEAPGVAVNGRPAYYVFTDTGDGMQPVMRGARQAAWYPNWQTSPERNRREKADADRKAKAVAGARDARQDIDARRRLEADEGLAGALARTGADY